MTSQPVHPLILEYYLNLLTGVPPSHARAHLTMLCAYDGSTRPLTEKILERPRLIQRIRAAIHDPMRAHLTVFNSTPLERKLAVLLGIPLNGLDPQFRDLGTESGSRKVFRQAGVESPAGFEDLATEYDVADALLEIRRLRPGATRAVIKLNESFSGRGNALFRFPQAQTREAMLQALTWIEFSVPSETQDRFFEKFRAMQGVVEEFLAAPDTASPSAQLRTGPRAGVLLLSTHDQILGGPTGQVYQGCRFPAHDGYRRAIQDAGLRIGRVLAGEGAVSRFGVDFVALRDAPSDSWRIVALEINLRMVGTTHPFLALKFLTGGDLDPASGLFYSLGGRAKFYKATDNLRSEAYRGLLPEDLIDILTRHQLHYDPRTECGVLFHLIGAVSEYGELGLTAIANSHEEAGALYASTLAVLDSETTYGRPAAQSRASLPGPL